MCAKAGASRPGPLSFLFSYQRPHTYRFQISQEQRERESTDRKGIFSFFLFFSLARLTECMHPSHFTEESNYSFGLTLAQQRQRPTWQPSDINQLNSNWVPKLVSAERAHRLSISLLLPTISLNRLSHLSNKKEKVPGSLAPAS